MNCTCGNEIKDSDFSITGGSTKNGEEFYNWVYECDNCICTVERCDWGIADDLEIEDLKVIVMEEINKN